VSPIRASERARYPANWTEISLRIREHRAGNRCECAGQCGHDHAAEFDLDPLEHLGALDFADVMPGEVRCCAQRGHQHPVTGSTVVLTTAHLDHQPENCGDENLRALCQRCHLAYDADHHAETRAATRRAVLDAQMAPLFTLEVTP